MTVAHYRLFEPSGLRFRLLWIWLVLGHPESRGWLSIMDSVTFLQYVLMRFEQSEQCIVLLCKTTDIGGWCCHDKVAWLEGILLQCDTK